MRKLVDKSVVVGFFVLAALTMGSMSVMGILQSSETVASSGVITRPAQGGAPDIPPGDPPPPPPEPTVEIDVYSNSGCTVVLSSVVWGEITAGESVHRSIYVKNNGDAGVVLSLQTESWSPASASDYMSLTWGYDGDTLQPGQSLEVVLTLSVSAECPEMSGFSFDIVIVGS